MEKYKRNILVYAISMGVPALAVFLVSLLGLEVGGIFSVLFAVETALFFGLVSRIVVHSLVDKDNSTRTWQLTTYFIIGLLGFTGVIVFESAWAVSLCWAISITSAIMFFSVRYLDKDENGIPDYMETDSEVLHLYETMRFRLVGDVLGGAADASRPLCLVNGDALTINEAVNRGYKDVALDGKQYIKNLIIG